MHKFREGFSSFKEGWNKQLLWTYLGQPCRAAAGERDYCHFHANPGVAAQVGRMGGRQNRHVVEGHATPLPPLKSISGVQGGVEQTIADLRARRLPARTAAVLANLFSLKFQISSNSILLIR